MVNSCRGESAPTSGLAGFNRDSRCGGVHRRCVLSSALTWDGAGYVFNSIQRGRPAIPNGRYSDYPFLAVISVCSLFINDARWVARIYGLVLAVLPLGSLVLSFHFLRGPKLRELRIWPVLGILLSVLPGQIFLVAEAVPLVQVAWAVWAIVAGEISGPVSVVAGSIECFPFLSSSHSRAGLCRYWRIIPR